MASVITLAFEGWKAQEAATGKPVLLNEFVFANVPNLDPTKPIDRNEKLPPANQIVHRQAVNKAGLVSENAVAYSVTLGADVGDFDFNWIGLLNKESGTVAMITHAPLQKKLKTQNGQQGNVLIRSFLLEFNGAAEETQIKTSAETWQIDFTARLTGMDEMQRLINVDNYGAAAFFNDGFEVIRSGEQFTVKKGLGYVGGLRGQLEQNQILNGLRNTKIYADFSYQGNIVSKWNTVIKITSAATLNNYVDAAGFTHQVFAIASIDTSGNVKDLRPKGALSTQSISELDKKINDALDGKQDKGDYAIKGDSYTKVEANIRFQPVGNYATSADLKAGLDKKFNVAGGTIEGGVTVTNNITSNGDVIQVVNAKNNQAIQMDVTNDGLVRINSRSSGGSMVTHLLPEKAGEFMQLGDYGFAGRGLLYNYSQSALETALLKDSTPSQIFRNDSTNTLTYRYSPSLLMRTGDTSALLSIDVDTANVRATSVLLTNGTKKTNELYGTANTNIDKNGYLRTGSSSVDIIGIPIGGSILWNTSAPIPDGFWPNEGRSFSATDYPELAKVFPSLKLPDDRGYAIRSADNGRGKDPGRTVGTYQEDAMMNLTGEFTARTDSAGVATGVFTKGNAGQTMAQGSNNILGTVSFNAGNQVPTANEFRMKNVSKILITRIK